MKITVLQSLFYKVAGLHLWWLLLLTLHSSVTGWKLRRCVWKIFGHVHWRELRKNSMIKIIIFFTISVDLSMKYIQEIQMKIDVPRPFLSESTAQKMKFYIKDFFSKCDQICRKLQIWSHYQRNLYWKSSLFVVLLFLVIY